MARPKTPTDVLKLRGSWRAKIRANDPADPDTHAPICPDWLDAEAKKKWGEMTTLLLDLGILAEVDGDVLAVYCTAWSEFKRATETVNREGRYIKTQSGYVSPHPAIASQRNAMRAIRQFASFFGLSPMDRVRGLTMKPRQESIKARFFS